MNYITIYCYIYIHVIVHVKMFKPMESMYVVQVELRWLETDIRPIRNRTTKTEVTQMAMYKKGTSIQSSLGGIRPSESEDPHGAIFRPIRWEGRKRSIAKKKYELP